MARSLSAFMADAVEKVENVLYPASTRIKDPETGEPMMWEICAISASENAQIRKSCMKTIPAPGGRKGQFTQEFDGNAYQAKIAVRCTVFPDLNDAALQDSYKAMGTEKLITTMLTPGEFEDYSAKVLEVNGFQNVQEMVDEAKN